MFYFVEGNFTKFYSSFEIKISRVKGALAIRFFATVNETNCLT